jgi:hypothetical protein
MDEIGSSASEHQWHSTTDPTAMCKMLDILADQTGRDISERKLRLLLIACIRRLWHVFKDERTRNLIEVVEQVADGLITQNELDLLWTEAGDPPNLDAGDPDVDCPPDIRAARYAAQALGFAANNKIDTFEARTALQCLQEASDDPTLEAPVQVGLLREIFDNPFRPPSIDLAYLTPAVRAIAEAAYQERSLPTGHLDLARLAVLADALEEAGCTD